jgi:hypothetical protein
MKRFLIAVILFVALSLVACYAISTPIPSGPQAGPVTNPVPTPTDDPALLPTLFPNTFGGGEMARTDQQGAVVIEVEPLNLGTPADTLVFGVSLNTHSVDLSMDLAALATLSTDTGLAVPASAWDAPSGGHHVSGTLRFPATKDGRSVLEGASKLTLTILRVDAPTRVFEWQLK